MGLIGQGRAASRALAFASWTAGMVYGHGLIRRVRPELDTWPGRQRYLHAWSRGVLRVFGLELSVVREVEPLPAKPLLVVANHRSPLDILLTLHLVGGVVLSHHGVAEIPVIGEAARFNHTIFVDRADRRSGAIAVRAMRRHLREGRNVIVFPEGDTFVGDEVRPFKPGSFLSARGLPDVRVLPVGLAYEPGAEYVDETFEAHLLRMCARPRHRVFATIGSPLPVPERALEASVRVEVQRLVDAAAARRDEALGR